MTKNFTLDKFKFPGIAGLEYKSEKAGFGTDTDSALTYNEFAENSAMPFTKQVAEEVTQDIEIEKLDYDVKLLLSANCTITLPTSSSIKNGRQVTIIPRFVTSGQEDDEEDAVVTDGTNSWIIEEHTDLILVWNGFSWKESNYTLREKINTVINSCYTGRDLRKVLFELGDIQAEHYSDIQFYQVMDALHKRCEDSDFSGLGLGDYIDHPSITVLTCNVSDVGGNGNKVWGYNSANSSVQENGEEKTFNKDEEVNNTRIRISGFNTYSANAGNTKGHILFEYENCLFQGKINFSQSSVGGYPSSCLCQWLNNAFYESLKAVMNKSDDGTDLSDEEKDSERENYIMPTKRSYSTIYNGWSGAEGTYYVFLPSVAEVAGYPAGAYNSYGNSYPKWPIYSVACKKRRKTLNSVADPWWLADPYSETNGYFIYLNDNGCFNMNDATEVEGIAPAFCIC